MPRLLIAPSLPSLSLPSPFITSSSSSSSRFTSSPHPPNLALPRPPPSSSLARHSAPIYRPAAAASSSPWPATPSPAVHSPAVHSPVVHSPPSGPGSQAAIAHPFSSQALTSWPYPPYHTYSLPPPPPPPPLLRLSRQQQQQDVRQQRLQQQQLQEVRPWVKYPSAASLRRDAQYASLYGTPTLNVIMESLPLSYDKGRDS
eukprot:CAMPEP_0175059150 /NCGR_PEP_ID=MMETSP0052_2-20121109/12266_1 /TAXON_ID=51329 ORGANISM="Polytomella parva, Strain SAG 63-3" /NCGR_SAMPLE_ID=MMETSP0052_2 /ASSEMBLY_ACC=CAM_ASM_000194 /LENGTH=200 /DNA_ID=CAMNT_0016324655 /DNA_START=197 /DNA_END=796 /DNA_ORIENTATION=+